MDGPSSDVTSALLSSELPDATDFTSPVPSASSSKQSSNNTASEFSSELSSLTSSRSSPGFYIEVPRLSTPEKALYKPLSEYDNIRFDSETEEGDLESIAGEYQEGRTLFYYARRADGICHRFPAEIFGQRHPELLRKYEQQKEEGTLPPFDPSATYVHPASRVKMVIRFTNKPSKKTSTLESSEDEFANGMSSDDAFSVYSEYPQRRSTRTAAADANKALRMALPFSPKKIRSRRFITIHSSGSESEGVEGSIADSSRSSVPKRRLRRLRSRVADDADGYETPKEETDDSDQYVPGSSKRKVIQKKEKPRKRSQPAYGFIRPVEDLQDENDEDAALRSHRKVCEKCLRGPTHQLLAAYKKRAKRGRKRKDSDEDDENEEDRLTNLGGWVRCLKCPVAAHWSCLAKHQRDEILRAARRRDIAIIQSNAPYEETSPNEDGKAKSPPRIINRTDLEVNQLTEFVCGSCMKGGVCMACTEVVLEAGDPVKPTSDERPRAQQDVSSSEDVEMTVGPSDTATAQAPSADTGLSYEPSEQLLFRCITCKRVAHYEHLPVPSAMEPPDGETKALELAQYYQTTQKWQCSDCISYVYSVEHIIAWRPWPKNAVEPPRPNDEPANYKAPLPREYLVKWADRSFRRTQWVPHMWLLATSPARLKNFIAGGTKLNLLDPEQVEAQEARNADTFDIEQELSKDSSDAGAPEPQILSPLVPNPDAERQIPSAWKTVDRVLDVLFWRPESKRKRKSANLEAQLSSVYENGEMPSADLTQTMNEYETHTDTELGEDQADLVAWAFFKWKDLGYEDATWDSPPRKGEPGYEAFKEAFKRYLHAEKVDVPVRSKAEIKLRDSRPKNAWSTDFTVEKQPELGQANNLKLMDFQADGVNWLCRNWWNNQSCILADEMGLGKTVQIVTFIGCAVNRYEGFPVLVVVPNSTLTNWIREFERWAPELRVVPFHGESKAREVAKRFELTHAQYDKRRTTGAKYHVLVTTFEMVTNKTEFNPVFKQNPRWEIVVIDEGQRLKNDSSLIFKKLKALNSAQRIIMTGTPLNNNIRELFNLMNFLDPDEWNDLETLSKHYEELSEDKIKELHSRLRPYFLRRVKGDVLKLPPKHEVIVPISMAPLQKEVYRSILSQNLSMLQSLAQKWSEVGRTPGVGKTSLRTNMNNILMQLRKCLQHPYLVSDDIEPGGLSPVETHQTMIDASAKLRLLKLLLPRLKARGHRVLLFSQFSIALNIVEDFLNGENIKYLRLDGNTKQSDRQKGMDEFNKPGSDVFIYLLTTRAGGVGINLWSADTVIIFDPDFNPHQDLQAISRAHRYGQQKTCLVFKLMVKDSAEEKIMQTGKKKLVLDHLIVQKMDDEDGSGTDVQSILMYGAMALFEEGSNQVARDIQYSEHDIDNLIEKTEKEGEEQEPEKGSSVNSSFSFAKVWSADKDTLEDMADDAEANGNQVDAWAQALERLVAERKQQEAKERTGRGVRRKAAAVFPQQTLDLGDNSAPISPMKKSRKGKGKIRSKSTVSDDSDVYILPEKEDASGSESTGHVSAMELDDLPPATSSGGITVTEVPTMLSARNPSPPPPKTYKSLAAQIDSMTQQRRSQSIHQTQAVSSPNRSVCGLCKTQHEGTSCIMTGNSHNLAEYRRILLVHAGDEPLEQRSAAVRAIDETLQMRGMLHLIWGQPLNLVEKPSEKSAVMPSQKNSSVVARNSPSLVPSNGVAQMIFQSGQSKLNTSNSVGSSSKRSSPIDPGSPSKKRRPEDRAPVCPVCGHSPRHLIKQCPVVAGGPKQISMAIRQLEGDPNNESTVGILRKLMTKQQRSASIMNTAPTIDASHRSTSSKDLRKGLSEEDMAQLKRDLWGRPAASGQSGQVAKP